MFSLENKQIHHENMINEIIAEVYCTGNKLNGLKLIMIDMHVMESKLP